MCRLLRISALAVLIVVACAAALAQFRFCYLSTPFAVMQFPSHGIVLFIYSGWGFEAGWSTVEKVPLGRLYLLPYHGTHMGGHYFFLPWLWIVSGWGIFTAAVYRLTRAKPTPSAFPVEGAEGLPP